tara:strand:+ start:2836 stop:3243 length:408 start_codon:yes stop_codon:yes gene_type:complete
LEINSNKEFQHCGSKPKTIAFGIAPLGIISIGIVPMGVVSIGIVPMGVISFGAVAMGIVNLSIVGMGIISSGITTMGVWEYSPRTIGSQGHHHNPISKNEKMLFRNKEEALKKAEKLNCEGAHKMGSFWMPCKSH